MSLRNITNTVSLRCEDCAEVVTFMKHSFREDDVSYEIALEDSYCGGGYTGILGRMKRAWRAFWAKPIYYSGVYIEDGARVKTFLEDCLKFIEEVPYDNQGD